MPTATLIPRNGSSLSHPSSVVVTLVSSSSVGSSLVNSNCKDQDTSISPSKNKIRNSGGDEVSILQSKKKMQGSKEKKVAKNSQPGVKAKIRKKCSFEGCSNFSQWGGVCWTHGAKVEKKCCSHEGCTNGVIKGGVCITHGAKVKRCNFKGCTNQVQKGGVCIKHGAKVKRCNFEGCTNQVQNGGVCITHGAKVEKKQCGFDGCTHQVQKGGVCWTHGAKLVVKSLIH
jgi:hypothetical protein